MQIVIYDIYQRGSLLFMSARNTPPYYQALRHGQAVTHTYLDVLLRGVHESNHVVLMIKTYTTRQLNWGQRERLEGERK